jgi:hypothetical protein
MKATMATATYQRGEQADREERDQGSDAVGYDRRPREPAPQVLCQLRARAAPCWRLGHGTARLR